jgi:hypothetical protein
VMKDMFGDASDHSFDPVHPTASDHDQVRVPLVDLRHDLFGHVTEVIDDLNR